MSAIVLLKQVFARLRESGKVRNHETMPNFAKPRDPARRLVQYACVPYRIAPDGQVEIALITSRETKRWVIPKGWPMEGKKPHAAAAREALEEAGLVGDVGRRALGTFSYDKRLRSGLTVRCDVEVFPLAVTGQRKRWREQGQRVLRWLSPAEAADAVVEPELKEILLRFGESVTPSERAGAA